MPALPSTASPQEPRVSPGFNSVARDELLQTDNIHWHQRARLDEISILAPGEIAWYVGAKVTDVLEPADPPAARTKRPDAGKVIIHDPPVLVRRYFPTEIKLR